jgi:hypothetical protein
MIWNKKWNRRIWNIEIKLQICHFFRLRKVSSKFRIYKFLFFNELQLPTASLLFLSIAARLSMIKSLYLYTWKYRRFINNKKKIKQFAFLLIKFWENNFNKIYSQKKTFFHTTVCPNIWQIITVRLVHCLYPG